MPKILRTRPPGIVARVARFLSRYVVLPRLSLLVVANWIVASWLTEVWDRFPHLAITSPERRCGKTLLLRLMTLVTPNARDTANITPAAIWRLIEQLKPTLLIDEAQALSRKGSESSEVMAELLNSSIDKKSVVIRCVGKNHDPKEFPVYCPKAIALIGKLDGVLADRCLPIVMSRKSNHDDVEHYRIRAVESIGKDLSDEIQHWAEANCDGVREAYDAMQSFDISNDRMAELLLPLQAVLRVDDPEGLDGLGGLPGSVGEKGGGSLFGMLRDYALDLEAKESDPDQQSPGVMLLAALREIFATRPKGQVFFDTATLLANLIARREEPWYRWHHGQALNPERLAQLLRPYGIKSTRNKTQTARGYYRADFEEAFAKYLPPAIEQTPASPQPTRPSVLPTPIRVAAATRRTSDLAAMLKHELSNGALPQEGE